ncbi:hypothetical protein H8958_012669 [Nasalis larvatus]
MLGYLVVTKVVGEEGEEGSDVENQDDSNVGATDSGILLAMSFDCYVAICNPLCYAAVLTNGCIMVMSLDTVLSSFALILVFPLLLNRLPFCNHQNILSHAYCLHVDMIKLACTAVSLNSHYGQSIVLFTFGLDSILIFISYVLIL